MGRYQKYPAYRDSNVDGVGRIPAGWSLTRLKFVARCLDGQRVPLNATERGEMEGDIPYWGANRVVGHVNDFIFDEDLVLLGEDGAPFFEPNRDVAFFVTGKIWPNNHVHVLRPESSKVESRFLTYGLNCTPFHLHITGSTRDKLNQSDMDEIVVRWCPLAEQTQIAKFLDYETAKIDALIEKQQQLIALLKEKRQAVISHAVTKGLNPDASMRDSGVEWLGEVPAHWKAAALKHLVQSKSGAIKTGPFGSQLTAADMEGSEYKVYNQRSVIDADFESGDVYVSESKFRSLASFEAMPGDLLVTTRGTIGRAAILPEGSERGILHPCLLRVQTDPQKINNEFLRWLVQESDFVKTQLGYLSNSTTIDVIYSNTMASVMIPVPPIDEQGQIVAFLLEKTGILDRLIEHAQSGTELLQERRTALISAAVTGKIDVRGWKPPESKPQTEAA